MYSITQKKVLKYSANFKTDSITKNFVIIPIQYYDSIWPKPEQEAYWIKTFTDPSLHRCAEHWKLNKLKMKWALSSGLAVMPCHSASQHGWSQSSKKIREELWDKKLFNKSQQLQVPLGINISIRLLLKFYSFSRIPYSKHQYKHFVTKCNFKLSVIFYYPVQSHAPPHVSILN